MPQQTMNRTAEDWLTLWDDELNSLWKRIMDGNMRDVDKQRLKEDQEQWIKEKDAKIKTAGAQAEGGTLQPYLEASAAQVATRARCYELGEILAEELDQDYSIPESVNKTLGD